MKRLFSLLMLCSLALATQLLDAGCGCAGEESPRNLTRSERRKQKRAKIASKPKVQARSKSKKRKTKKMEKIVPHAKKEMKKITPAKAGKVHIVTSKAELDALKAKGKPVVVKYKATWCGACTMIADYFKKLAGEFDHMIFVEVDIDKDGGLSGKEGVKALPTIHVHKAKVGKVGELVGANKDALHQLVKTHSQKGKVVKEIKARS